MQSRSLQTGIRDGQKTELTWVPVGRIACDFIDNIPAFIT